MKLDEYAIQTQGLSKRYDEVDVLNALDLTVPKNAIFGFLGPNGAGKSTTMKLLLGLVEPTAGSASIFGLDTVRDSLAIRARIGYLPQQPHFYGHLTARETLRFVANCYYRGPAGAVEARVEEALALVGLEQKADRPVRGFSGGERQRLGLAQAQINEPELLILDEPAAALDPIGRHDVLAIMARLRQRATIFYSTHILDDVQQVSDTVAILNQGQLITQGPIEALLSGDGALVYSVTTKGDPDRTRQRLADQPWITAVDLARHNGTSAWQVRVTDEATAEALLLRLLLADEQITVTEFTRKRYQLEEVFIDLIEGDNNGRA